MESNKIKIYELAKTLGVKSVFLMDKMRKEWNLPVKSHMESLNAEQAQKIKEKFLKEQSTQKSEIKKKRKTVIAKKAKTATKRVRPVTNQSDQKSHEISKKTTATKVRVIRRSKADQKMNLDLERPSTDDMLSKEFNTVSPKPKTETVADSKSDSLKDLLSNLDQESVEEKEHHKKQPKKPLVEKEVVSKFHSTDFRKREVIFQPKKKRVLTTGNFKSTQITTPKAHKRVLKVYGEMKIDLICKKIRVKRSALIKKLKAAGVDTKDVEVLDFETIALIIPDFGFEAKNTYKTEQELLKKDSLSKGDVAPRAPIVTIMGHVDHGKTTLLDAIRKTKVVEQESGGITQHIGAYSVTFNESFITFIDTPGHEAFTAMRARGAQATDIVIIVVSAVEGVRPQTIEAINHAKAAKIPIIVGMTKMDSQGANPDKIKQQMSEYKIVPEDWGGDTSFQPLSAIKGEGLKELLEQIHLLAEIQELTYYPKQAAQGTVLEARMEKGRGCVVSLLVQDGILCKGDYIVAGRHTGKVRQMKNDIGQLIQKAVASTPVEVIGLSDLPQAGDAFNVMKDEKAAKELINYRTQKQQQESVAIPLSVEDLLTKTYGNETQKELNLILKADVKGSLEALKAALDKFTSENITLKLVHSAVGAIKESDILLASTVSGVVIGFNVRPDGRASKVARDKSIKIHSYSVIYELLDDVTNMMLGLLEPEYVEEELGKAEVRNIFHISKLGTVAGCYVTDGKMTRHSFVRLVRDGRLIHNGPISSLKRFKEDAKEVSSGLECGVVIEQFNDVKPKDILESYIKKEISRTQL